MPLPDQPRLFEIYDVDSSSLLATAREAGEAGARGCVLSCIAGNGALLSYYYGRGKRDVVVRSGPNEGMTAHLATRWHAGKREWTLD
jgi:hypothetical protein